MMSRKKEVHLLRAAARSCGVATSYRNSEGNYVPTSEEGLISMINILQKHTKLWDNPDVASLKGIRANLRVRNIERGLPAVVIAWDKSLPPTWLWLKGDATDITITLRSDEGGDPIVWTQPINAEACIKREKGRRFRIVEHSEIPYGYYTIEVMAGDQLEASSFLISAPTKTEQPQKQWGIFAPAYALTREQDEGIGGYRELQEAARFVSDKGGTFLGTLPLLANFYEGAQKNISPYSPISRLFWNEIYLDTENLPGVSNDPQNNKKFNSAAEFVNYDDAYALKKKSIQSASQRFFDQYPDGDADYQAFKKTSAYLDEYALFRAETYSGEEKEEVHRYHLYAQYACHTQLLTFKRSAAEGESAELYIDYPIGIDTGGFDAQRFGDLFLRGFQVGAPPDMFFTKGQSWGFMPFDPRAFEEDHFAYFRATIYQYFRYARMLRLDHIMGFYRIYCIPDGKTGADGAYIYYPLQAFLAVLCLEAHRHGGILIGEDLGTVPDAVRTGMEQHMLNRMWILQFEVVDHPKEKFDTIKENMIASFNTHDMFPFASFLSGHDLEELERLELLGAEDAKRQFKRRQKPVRALKKQTNPLFYGLEELGKSPARFVLINMEDLWGETEPQNIPGTIEEYPDWRKRFSVPLERWNERKDINEALELLDQARKS